MIQDFRKKSSRLLHFIIIAAAFLSLSCEQLPEADFYESSGIVSIDARSLGDQNNWRSETYFTSVSMVSYEDTLASSVTLTFPFFIRRPGTYTIWTLSRQADSDPEQNYLPLRVMDANNFLLENFRLELNESHELEWLNRDTRTGEPITVHFEQPGHYSVIFESQGRSGYLVDKLHLSLENARRPSGMGFPETNVPGGDPVLAKREQRKVIPPAWAFGVMMGGYADQQEVTEQIRRMEEGGFPVDAYWIARKSAEEESSGLIASAGHYQTGDEYPDLKALWEFMRQRNIKPGLVLRGNSAEISQFDEETADQFRSLVDPFFDDGLAFLKLDTPADISLIRTAFEASLESGFQPESRGFTLSHPHQLHKPEFKEYPATWTGRSVSSWSHPVFPDFERNMMGGLRENIEMAANPRLSTYEVPFLSHNVGGYHLLDDSGSVSDELFIRWVQFASFNTMMQIFTSPDNESANLPYNFSEEVQEQFRKYTHLRNRLFPYIYSLAHLVRPAGVKPVRGDGDHTTQFRLGNSLLIAPVYEEGAREREVYLPEGIWYDYWDGTRYDGGQYITAEAPLKKIPVYVQAGAIIPYRQESRNILSGSNEQLTIEVYGGDRGTFRLYEDDGVSTRYQVGEFTTTAFRYFEHPDFYTFTIGRMVREYEGQASEKELLLKFKFVDEPSLITAEEEPLEKGEGPGQWRYNAETRTLYISWVQPNEQKTDFYMAR
ncbi:MAG: glycoside hydrolase family 31 protein [Balneolaceae bacterium]|nr:glycoside hydrolase family 31 protein [Balneolaceae bacterium]